LSHKFGALKRDGVKAWQMVCNMVIFENIRNGRTTTKMLGVDKQFFYKAMKKRDKLLILNMPRCGASRSNFHSQIRLFLARSEWDKM
jgi:hypothetical protein